MRRRTSTLLLASLVGLARAGKGPGKGAGKGGKPKKECDSGKLQVKCVTTHGSNEFGMAVLKFGKNPVCHTQQFDTYDLILKIV